MSQRNQNDDNNFLGEDPDDLMNNVGRIITVFTESGGASGSNDFAEATETAVINKRAGGMGLISGRKAFQRPMSEGTKLLNTIQDVYLCDEITIA